MNARKRFKFLQKINWRKTFLRQAVAAAVLNCPYLLFSHPLVSKYYNPGDKEFLSATNGPFQTTLTHTYSREPLCKKESRIELFYRA